MKKHLIFMLILVLSLPVAAQVSSKDRKEARKEQKKREEAEQAAIVQTSLQAKKYVLEAQFLANNYGQRVVVDPIINFIMVDGEKGSFQFGNSQVAGYNGVGGVTVEGKISDYKVDVSKKGVYYITFRIASSAGTIFTILNISPLGDADATISGNTSTKLKYSGKIVPLEVSRVFKSSRSF